MNAKATRSFTPHPAKRRRVYSDGNDDDVSKAHANVLHLKTLRTPSNLLEPSWKLTGSNNELQVSNEKPLLVTNPDCETRIWPDPECCYGMLRDIPAKLGCGLRTSTRNALVEFLAPNILKTGEKPPLAFEISCTLSARILAELQSVVKITTQLHCYSKHKVSSNGGARQKSRRRENSSEEWSLNAIILGPEDFAETLGEHLSKHKMYLQDPIGCERDLPYRNPHIVPSESGEIVMTSSFDQEIGGPEIERLQEGPDLLAQLMEGEPSLSETEAPRTVNATLFRHQKQALTFMVRREEGWALEADSRDIWSRQIDTRGRISYVNNVSGYNTDEMPSQFRGGLLADDIGLCKTLSMICLIAANQSCQNDQWPFRTSVVKTTLLIVPPAVIQHWKTQFSQHLDAGTLTIHIHHGQNREQIGYLGDYDVVITTYYTISAIYAIWKKHGRLSQSDSSIFSLTWHRVILDEAHIIQNPASQLAQACCALRSRSRWAITGTPIQNKLADFASIVRFLRVYPYSDQKTFDADIIRPWQNRHKMDARGFLRLKTLVRAIAIGRTKAVVQLPDRADEIHHLEFTSAEKEAYETAKVYSRALLEDSISSRSQDLKTFNVLSLLNNLRLICNHGLLAQYFLEKRSPCSSRDLSRTLPSYNTSRLFGDLDEAASCPSCGGTSFQDNINGHGTDDFNTQPNPIPDHMLCEKCSPLNEDSYMAESSWNLRPYPGSADYSLPSTPALSNGTSRKLDLMSTKIKALVNDLCKHITDEKSVVFSYWTTTLDLVGLMLDDRGISYARIDGKMSLPNRNESQHAFQHNDTVRVILVSITCGGAGLDLTAGSRVYLLEPQWNPMVEEQALCRAHRVGQKRDVTTIRYLMRDSFEEQVVEIQKRKKLLAQMTFSQGPLEENSLSLGILQYLQSALE